MTLRTPTQWQQYASQHIRGGYVAGSNVSRFYEFSRRLLQDIALLTGAIPTGDILDVGCGNGRLPVALDGHPINSYCGIDVNQPAIAFCRDAFATSTKHQFILAEVHNGHYASHYQTKPLGYHLPFPDNSFDFAVANSFFTHTGPRETAQHYLAEIARVLRPSGQLYSTWYRSPPHTVSSTEARTVYGEKAINDMLSPHFIVVADRVGNTPRKRDQWRILLEKR